MAPDRDMSIGQRMAHYRRWRGLTQQALAMRLNLSKSWVAKVERGERSIDSITTLMHVARALGVELQMLTGRPLFPEPTGQDGAEREGVVLDVRRVLMHYDKIHGITPAESSAPPRPLAELRREARAARRIYDTSANNFSAVVYVLVELIGQTQHAAREASGDQRRAAYVVLAELYRLTAMEMRQYGDFDLAWMAADRGLLAAEQSEDGLLIGACAGTLIHQIIALGRLKEAIELAMDTATLLKPGLKNATPAHLSVWGALHLYSSLAAARALDRGECRRLLDIAMLTADQVGADRNDYATFFGPTNVGIQETGTLVDLEDPKAALRRAETVAAELLPSVNRRCYHHLHLARAHGLRRRDPDAVRELLAAEAIGPEIVRWDPTCHELVRSMLRRERRRTSPELRGLAQRLRVLVA